MPRRSGQADGGRDWFRYLGDLSRVVVITTSVLGVLAGVLLLILVALTLLGVV
jgi:hypothetical protein